MQRVRDDGDADRRREHEPDRQQRDRPDVVAAGRAARRRTPPRRAAAAARSAAPGRGRASPSARPARSRAPARRARAGSGRERAELGRDHERGRTRRGCRGRRARSLPASRAAIGSPGIHRQQSLAYRVTRPGRAECTRGGARWKNAGSPSTSWTRCHARRWTARSRRSSAATWRPPKTLCEEMKHEWRLLHDLMAGGMAGLVSFVQERLGDDGVEEAWEYSLERGWRSHAEAIVKQDRRWMVHALAANWRAHSCSGTGPAPRRVHDHRGRREVHVRDEPVRVGSAAVAHTARTRGRTDSASPTRRTTGATGARAFPSTAPTARS